MSRFDAPSTPSWRRKTLMIAAVAAVVAPVAAFAAIYLLFFNNDSPAPLILSTGTPPASGTPVSAAGLPGEWSVAEGSIAGYRVREKLARLPAQSDGVGRTSAVTGTVTIDAGAGGALVMNAASLEVDVTRLESDEGRRDRRIRTDGLESDQFPTAAFVADAPIELPAEATTGASVTLNATGALTIHGVTKTVTIPIQARLNGAIIELVGSITFPFADFGMTPPSIGDFVQVEDNATMEFQVFLAKAG